MGVASRPRQTRCPIVSILSSSYKLRPDHCLWPYPEEMALASESRARCLGGKPHDAEAEVVDGLEADAPAALTELPQPRIPRNWLSWEKAAHAADVVVTGGDEVFLGRKLWETGAPFAPMLGRGWRGRRLGRRSGHRTRWSRNPNPAVDSPRNGWDSLSTSGKERLLTQWVKCAAVRKRVRSTNEHGGAAIKQWRRRKRLRHEHE